MLNKRIKVYTKNFAGEKRSTYVNVIIQDRNISIESGRDLTVENLWSLLADREINKEVKQFLKEYKRLYPFKIKEHQGFSGCREYKLFVAKQNKITSQEVKVESLYVSCNYKISSSTYMYLGDLIEFLNYIDGESLNNLLKLSVRQLKLLRKDILFYPRRCKYASLLTSELEVNGYTNEVFKI